MHTARITSASEIGAEGTRNLGLRLAQLRAKALRCRTPLPTRGSFGALRLAARPTGGREGDKGKNTQRNVVRGGKGERLWER